MDTFALPEWQNLPFHPIADIFPLIDGADLDALIQDIKTNGLHEPIWLHSDDNSIIDGRNRYRACIAAGVTPRFRRWSDNGGLVQFVLSLNLHRRHLTSSQRAALAVEILPILEAEAKERQRLNALKNQPQNSQKIDYLDGQATGRATAQAATLTGSNRQYVSDMKTLHSEAPALFAAVRDGAKTVTQAKREHRAQTTPKVVVAEAETKIPSSVTVHNADSRDLSSLSIEPVHLVITSPPYNVGIDYATHDDNMSTDDYQDLLRAVFGQCWQVMEDGARIAVVVPFGVGRNPWTPVPPIIYESLKATGFTLRGQIIWDKNTTGNRTSWGSFRLPSNPAIRDTTEAIIVAHKGDGNLATPDSVRAADGKGTYTTALANSDYFMELAQDHWMVAPESAQRVRHPAPFPVELAKRLIDFYAYPGAHVFDPFGGSGTTAIAAMKAGCRATLVEIDAEYCRLAKGRLAE